ncbi:hypothetical protein SAMN02746065_11750 [Desulfocicer vacuolatum DSM 3385]|uniref:Uncharacterized protein n=1 Tax=Desulfocicer vacuolatum DSM 3385 TaxID=1121400 RepID=A0A1W2DF35_9BACT|nr:hypothetical protein [Desulfocicer vacuolatum]SMC96159.1 hypothetical protein SAMN02746065_11750 [Desulfocicer vacuolatum DSM 3385]
MAGKIFYRERRNVSDGAKKPRFRVVAVSDSNLKVYSDHLRLSELEHIAKATDAELICLQKGTKKDKK